MFKKIILLFYIVSLLFFGGCFKSLDVYPIEIEFSEESEINQTFVIDNTTYDLSATDSGNWLGSNSIYGIGAIDEDNVYIGATNGKFGRYNRTSNITTDLSATDPGNWVGTTGILSLFALDNDNIYLGISGGKFGVYSKTTNTTYDLSATDSGNWLGTNSIYGIYALDEDNVYIGATGGKFGRYSKTTNITTDLTGTDPGNWLGSNSIFGIYALDEDNVYIVGAGGKFGRYNKTSNITTDLSGTDTGNWLSTTTFYGVHAVDEDNVYIAGAGGKFGVYNKTSNITTDLSATDPADWIGTKIIIGLGALDENNVYLGGTGKHFGRYSRTTNITTDLTSTIPASWAINIVIRAIFALDNDNIYIGASGGRFGRYSKGIPVNPENVTNIKEYLLLLFKSDAFCLINVNPEDENETELNYSNPNNPEYYYCHVNTEENTTGNDWTPEKLDIKPTAWYDATDANTIFTENNNIIAWGNKAENGTNASYVNVTAYGTKPPTLSLNAINGLDALLFNDTYLKEEIYVYGKDIMVFMVGTMSSDSDNYGRGISLRNPGMRHDYDNIGSMIPVLRYTTTEQVGIIATTSRLYHNINYSESWLLSSGLNNQEVYLRFNGGEEQNVASSHDITAQNINLGFGNNGHFNSDYYNGLYGEIIIIENYNSTDIEKVEGYLAWKWGIEGHLPLNHTYKNESPKIN